MSFIDKLSHKDPEVVYANIPNPKEVGKECDICGTSDHPLTLALSINDYSRLGLFCERCTPPNLKMDRETALSYALQMIVSKEKLKYLTPQEVEAIKILALNSTPITQLEEVDPDPVPTHCHYCMEKFHLDDEIISIHNRINVHHECFENFLFTLEHNTVVTTPRNYKKAKSELKAMMN